MIGQGQRPTNLSFFLRVTTHTSIPPGSCITQENDLSFLVPLFYFTWDWSSKKREKVIYWKYLR